jgi:hypothetical protein
MGSDDRTFAAALIDMGVRGHVRMVEEDGGWFSSDKTRLERIASTEPLPEDEEAALRELAMTGESIVMEQKNHKEFSAAQKALGTVLKERYEEPCFTRTGDGPEPESFSLSRPYGSPHPRWWLLRTALRSGLSVWGSAVRACGDLHRADARHVVDRQMPSDRWSVPVRLDRPRNWCSDPW